MHKVKWRMAINLFLLSLLVVGQVLAAQTTNQTAGTQANPPSIDLGKLVQPIRIDNETFAASPAPLSNGSWAYLIYLNGTPAAMAVVTQSGDGSQKSRILEQEYEIRPALKEYYSAVGYLDMARKELAAAHALIGGMNAKEVGDCERMMGLSNHECDSYDSCFQACLTSQSICTPAAQGVGKSFIYQLWDYENRSRAMADALADEKRQYDATNSDLSLYTISIYKSSLQTVWTAENGLLAHPFNGWMCKKPFYDSAISSGVEQHLTKAESWIISLQGDDNMAQKLAAATAQREERNKALAQAADPLNVNALIGGEVSPIMLVGIGIGAAVVVGFAALFAMRRKKSDVEKKEQKD